MTSPFALLFLAIQKRLGNIIDVNSNGILGTIDQDLGQLEDNSKGMNRPPVTFPCALIDIDDATFQNEGDNAQLAVVNVCIRIGFPPFSSTELKVPPEYKNKALYYYDIEQAIVQAFHGWNPTIVNIDGATTTADLSDIFGHFIRVRVAKEDRNDLLRVRAIMFTLSMNDYSTAIGTTLVPATPNITETFQFPTP
jgi:hypothetical protein